MDALAAVAFFLGIVMEAAAPNYGHIYALLGIVLFGVALVVWVNGLMLAITAYIRAEKKTGPSIAIGFTLFSILSVFLLLLGSAGFWGR
jgi:hypothetical protein